MRKVKHLTYNNKPKLRILIFILTLPLILINFFLFYEYFFEPKYWNNRWRLFRLLKNENAKITKLDYNYNAIELYNLNIDNIDYKLEIWKKDRDLKSETLLVESYTGLFKSSFVTEILDKKSIKLIRILSNKQLKRELQLKKIGIK